MYSPIHIASEVDHLKAVLLHRPGKELESLTPQFLESMLFEDIPYLAQMQIEHDFFATTLKEHGAQVFYLESLLEEIFQDTQLHTAVTSYLVESSLLLSPSLKEILTTFLKASSPLELVNYCIGGVLKSEVAHLVREKTLSYYIKDTYPYYISPLPNLYFTRDPATIVNGGININVMKAEFRKRESYLLKLLTDYHPLFASIRTHFGYTMGSSIEGGDILIINEQCAVIGSSARTDVWAIESFARKMMSPIEQGGEGLKEVLVIQIPYTRAYMHLDTVCTMVDYDKFCLFPVVEPSLKIFSMTSNSHGSLQISEQDNLKKALSKALKVPSVDIIRSGGDDSIASAREQWNDSTNTLAVAPGVVVAYRRNVVSNETLEKHGITVIPIKGSELVRGRGGPRCMSMPLCRSKV